MPVELTAGEQIIVQGERSKCALFPASAVCSLTMVLKSGDKAEFASVGARSIHAIDYQRGVVRILDRKRLEQAACECYETARRYRRLLPWLPR